MTTKLEVSTENLIKLFGNFDENIRIIEDELNVSIKPRISGIDVSSAEDVNCLNAHLLIEKLLVLIENNYEVNKSKIRQSIDLVLMDRADEIINLAVDTVAITSRGKQIKCKTLMQKQYVQAIKNNTLVFGTGPAGTGKTYLAVALAVQSYKNHEVDKIILTRPAIEAGEKLGFLPGDLQMKVDPYLRPLYDALQEMFGLDSYTKLIERGIIEIAPLAYMRGRTLSNAFIILDEAQNTTDEQMKMFLTRMGENSRVIVTGDLTQIDLAPGKRSGLKTAIRLLNGIEKIQIVQFTHKDVVRHELVQKIVLAYEKDQKEEQ